MTQTHYERMRFDGHERIPWLTLHREHNPWRWGLGLRVGQEFLCSPECDQYSRAIPFCYRVTIELLWWRIVLRFQKSGPSRKAAR